MNKIKIILGAIFLTIILLAAQFLVFRMLTGKEGMIPVLAAARDISPGEIITEDLVCETEIVDFGLTGEFPSRPDEIYGKIATDEIYQGDVVTLKRLGDNSERENTELFGEDTRFITIEFKPDQANGWFIENGSFVDLLFIPDKTAGKTGSEEVSRINNVRVAYIINDKGGLYNKEEPGPVPKYVSFEINNKLDEILAYAKANGRIEISVIP